MNTPAEVLVLADLPPDHPVSLSMVSHLMEYGVDFASAENDTFPRELPDSLDGYKAILMDTSAFRRLMTDEKSARRIDKFAESGGYVTAVSETGVADIPNLRVPLMTKHAIDITLSSVIHDLILHPALNRFSLRQRQTRGAASDQAVLETLKAFILRNIRQRRIWDEFTGHFWQPAIAFANRGHKDVRDAMITAITESMPNIPVAEHHDVVAGFFAVPWLYDQTGDRTSLEQIKAIVDDLIARRPREMGVVCGAGFADDPLGTGRKRIDPGVVGSVMRRTVIWNEVLHFHGPTFASMARATGDRRYLDEAMRMVDHLEKYHLRADGILAHCTRNGKPLCAPWGRGQTHALYGMRYMLQEMTPGTAEFNKVIDVVARVGRGLRRYQDPVTGLWRNVIDHHDARLESTCTCGIACTYAMCINRGWLSRDEFGPMVRNACDGLKRVFWRGGLAAGCRGTGAAMDVNYYLSRPQGWTVVPQFAMALLDMQ